MKTKQSLLRKRASSKPISRQSRTTSTTKLLRLLLLVLVVSVRAEDYTYSTNDGTITITGYTGDGGAVIIPDTINGLPVATIGDHAFWFCTNMTSLFIPDGVTSIDAYAFGECINLIQATIGNGVTNIADYAFRECENLANVSLGKAVTSIGYTAFFNCNLDHVTIPASVTNLGSRAFGMSAGSSTYPLKGVYFRGDAPTDGGDVFLYTSATTVFYLPGTTGWGATYSGRDTVPWDPQILTDEASFGVGPEGFGFRVQRGGFVSWLNYITVVKASTNLSMGAWIPIHTNYPNALPWYDFNDPDWTNWPARFYTVDMP